MNTFVPVEVRRFSVTVKNGSGEIVEDTIILTKRQLQAAQLVGQSSKELIHRLYQRHGFRVIDIGRAEKKTVTVDLNALWNCVTLEGK